MTTLGLVQVEQWLLDRMVKDKEYWTSFFLRIGISFSFLYAGISAFLDPLSWAGFIPTFILDVVKQEIALGIHSTFNILLGIWLLSDRWAFYAAVVSSIALFSIVILNLNSMLIVFRDITILLAALALAVLTNKK